MIIFLLMNLIVGLSAFLLTYRILKLNNFIDSLLALFLIYFAQIVFSEVFLGISGILFLKNVILFNLAILLVIWLITKNRSSSFSLAGIKDSISGLLKNKIILLGIAIIAGFALVKVCVNLINPPFGWDSLNYHFTFAVEWLKHGNLDIPITICDDPAPSYYPINGSLFFLWLMFPLKNVFLADLGQVPFFILAFLAVYNISRKIGLEKEASFYAASIFLLIPNIFKQLQIAYVDVMVAALFLVCVNFLFLLNEKYGGVNTFVYGLGIGLLLGTKTPALPYAVLLLIPFIYLGIKNNKVSLWGILIFLVLVFGSFSYIRNIIETGNPLYPLDFSIFGKNIFKGVVDNYVYRAHFKLEDYRLSKLLFHEGLGIQTTILILPAIFLALPFALIKKRKEINFNLLYFLLLPLLLYGVYRYIIPLANTRYLYSLLGIGIICAFYAIKLLGIPKIITNILVIISYLSSFPELSKRQELISAAIVTVLLFLSLIFFNKFIKGLIQKPWFIISLIVFLISGLTYLNVYYNLNEYSCYPKMVKYSGFWPDATRAWEWLNRDTRGNNIAYTGRPVPFPLYGTNFKNNVYYVSVNKTDPAKLHYFPHSQYIWGYDFLSLHQNLAAKGNYRGDADYSVWLNNLLKRNTNYLFIYSLHQTKEIIFPMEDIWARNNPKKLSPVFKNETIHIYKILK